MDDFPTLFFPRALRVDFKLNGHPIIMRGFAEYGDETPSLLWMLLSLL